MVHIKNGDFNNKNTKRLQNGYIMEIYDDQLNIYRWIIYAILLINAGLYTVGI